MGRRGRCVPAHRLACWGLHRHGQQESRPCTKSAGDGNISAQKARQLPGYAQTQSGAAGFSRRTLLRLPERLKDIFHVLGRDPYAGVSDLNFQNAVVNATTESHLSLVGELDSVGEKIHQHLPELGAVRLYRLVLTKQLDHERDLLVI